MKAKNILFLILVFSITLVSCKSKEDKLKTILEKEKELMSDKSTAIDVKKGTEMADLYISFANDYPQEAQAPEFLFKAGEILMNVKEPKKAIDIFDQLIKDFPTYKNVPYGYFMKALTYDTQLKDFEKAHQTYKEFITKFPEHPLRKDAEACIMLLKPDAEIIKQLESNPQN